MNRINKLFQEKQGKVFSIYFTAGHPQPNTAASIIADLEQSGVDLIEIGMPFSDPLADGPVIQKSSQYAIDNGMSLKKLLTEIKDIRQTVKIPLILMGYFNTVLRFGVEEFCKQVSAIGIDGVILPDLPLEVYEDEYEAIFTKYNVIPVFLITPQTASERILQTNALSKGFIYMVSTASTTGAQSGYTDESTAYFKRINDMDLSVPVLTGFGISDKISFNQATEFSAGGIIGSAFVKALQESDNTSNAIQSFVEKFK